MLELGTGTAPETYFVQLEAPAVPRATSRSRRAASPRSGSESGYRKELSAEQADLRASISRVTGGPAQVLLPTPRRSTASRSG